MYCDNNKKYKCFTAILYVCLLNIVINNVSLSNEDTTTTIISKQEFQKLLDMKHNITGLKKISETMFELMFNNTNGDKEEEKPTTAPNDVSMSENIMNSFIELFAELLKSSKTDYNGILEILKSQDEVSYILLTYLPKMFDLVLQYESYIAKKTQQMTEALSTVQDSQPTKEEIAEIINKAISSYNEANKQTTEESNLYHIQIIQMLKDLTNKVDRLENISQKKEMTEKATQSTIQTFINGLCSSKVI